MAGGFGSGTEGTSRTAMTIILVFLAISLYNVVELTFIIFGTFKRHSGLYFLVLSYFAPASVGFLAAALIAVGWVAMVTGQSLVLWSRLHLVLRNRFRLKLVLYMIIVDAIVCHGAIIPMIFGSFSNSPEMWVKPYSVMEKIQVTIFFIQEIIISSFYIYETIKLMRLERTMGNKRGSRRLMNHLIFVNLLIILLDITILGLEYADQYEYQTSYKAFVYSTKLKLEFTILNRLVEMTTGSKDASSGPRSRTAGTTTGNKTGIALDTFISDTGAKPTGDVSYEAYAMGGEDGNSDGQGASPRRDNGVMMTTEIIVHRENRDDDGVSIGPNSSADSIGVAKGPFDGENLSKSSSEVHLATRGF
ncbi:hypothetical protein CEP52_015853 [Fusarium oligoseptatum]|uniref:DUF7703 domain-containing protein n=1 Tax=Fusarium oligoseptatum TaxID=2604345 RepID=A0A428S922_9HYPO|nr:hypothetical protein CEP52_015853 [Fusarium oligoseptatum]